MKRKRPPPTPVTREPLREGAARAKARQVKPEPPPYNPADKFTQPEESVVHLVFDPELQQLVPVAPKPRPRRRR